MTAPGATITCACCRAPRPAAEVFERIPRSGEWFCRDTAGCRKRMAAVGDPVGEFIASPPPAVAGAACSICGAADPSGGVYQRTASTYVCIDRPGCDERAVEHQFLHSWGDSSPDRLISPADMRAMTAAARPQVPPEPVPLDPARAAALAAQDRLGRKR